MPLFSVVIPLFNKEDYIKSTIQSVLNQSFKNFELIIVNDGSTDNSFKLAKECIQGLSNCRIIDQNNQGLSASRNRGVKEAKGELIAFVDADDIWLPDFLKHIHNLYNKFPEASIYGTSYFEKFDDESLIEPKKNLDFSKTKKDFTIDDFFETNIYQPIICQSSFAGKKTIFLEFKYNESLSLAVDIDWYIRVFQKHKLAYSNYPLAIIRVNIPNQMTNTGIINKKIPDLDYYEKDNVSNTSLKTYLDFYRYTFLIKYKLENDIENQNRLLSKIDLKNLTTKQKFLIKCPVLVLKLLKAFKSFLLKKNIRLTSF